MRLSAEALFETYLRPLYPADVLADFESARVTDANPAGNASVLAHLEEAAHVFVAMHPRALGRDVGLDFTDASVHRLSVALTFATDSRNRVHRALPRAICSTSSCTVQRTSASASSVRTRARGS
jgi:hypothetical protein